MHIPTVVRTLCTYSCRRARVPTYSPLYHPAHPSIRTVHGLVSAAVLVPKHLIGNPANVHMRICDASHQGVTRYHLPPGGKDYSGHILATRIVRIIVQYNPTILIPN